MRAISAVALMHSMWQRCLFDSRTALRTHQCHPGGADAHTRQVQQVGF